MKKLAIAICLSFATMVGVTGCAFNATKSVMHSGQKNVREVLFNDNIIAIAKPATVIDGYPNALIFVGNTNDYLLNGKKDLAMILDGLDLTHLTIKAVSDISLSEQGYYEGTMDFVYLKGVNALSDKEKMILQQVGAVYHTNERSDEYMRELERLGMPYKNREEFFIRSEFKMIPIEKTFAKTVYPSISAPSRMIEFYTVGAKNSKGKTVMLLPVAVIGDIITSPLQWLLSWKSGG